MNTRNTSLTSCTSMTSLTSSLLISAERLRLFRFESFHAAEHLIPIHGMSIELRTVHADKLRLTADRHAACAAHTRTVHHNGIQTRLRRDIVLRRRQRHELHHDSRTDRDTFMYRFTVDDLFYTYRHNTLLTGRTVIGHDDDLVGPLRQFILQDKEVFVTGRKDGDDSIAGFLERLSNRQHRRSTYASAGTYHRAVFLDARRFTERTNYIMDAVARVERQQFMR